MKRCPECIKDYLDDSLLYCLDDGAPLVQGSGSYEPATAILSKLGVPPLGGSSSEDTTRTLKADDTAARKAKGTSRLSTLFSRERLPWFAAAGFALIAAAAINYSYFNRSSASEKAVRLSFEPPPELSFNDVLPDAAVISPDGQKIAFSATGADGINLLYVREMDSTDAKLLPGSENPLEPFWSPDSRSVAFGSNGKLKRSELTGGNAQVLCDATRLTGGSWNKDGIILFGSDFRTGLSQVLAQGGEPKPATLTQPDNPNEGHTNPYFLPDGRRFLFRLDYGNDPRGIWSGSLDSTETRQFSPDGGPFVFSPDGWLVFVKNDALVAQGFDTSSLTLTGEPTPLGTGRKNAVGFSRRISVSDNGVLVWQGQWEREYQLVWFDRDGKQTGVVDAPMKVFVGQDPRLSPDGKRLAVKRDNNIWVIDLEKGTSLRITSSFSQIPIWSPDGTRIAYSATGINVKAANGLGDAENILPGTNFPDFWSPDGRFIIYRRRGVKTRLDLWSVPTFGNKTPYQLLNSQFDEVSPQLSPDGRWLAYATDDTGNYEVYVQSFSVDGKLGSDRKLISTTGGRMPVWRRDGSELFFIAQDGKVMASVVKTGGSEFEFTTPKALFKTRMLGSFGGVHEYDVSPDGQRFLIGTLIGESTAPPPTVILNWTAALKK